MAPDSTLDRVVDDLADGKALDWDLLNGQARTAEEREQLKWLRLLGDVANLHRPDPSDPSEPSTTAGSDAASAASTTDLTSGRGGPTAPADENLPRWGQFHLLEQVGAGSFGRVYRAWDRRLEREVAIKILHVRVDGDQLSARILREGRALAKVRHANVVTVHAVEAYDGRVGLCMEFLRGHTLDDALRRLGPFSPRATAMIGQDICRALAAVHGTGFVHGDVKARNVMQDESGRIVLMDFGTGRDVRLPTSAGAHDQVGTPLYMAPELLDGAAGTPSSDVYSLGVLMFHLLTGEYPVRATSLDALREAHRHGHRERLRERRPDVPPSLARIIECAVDPSPEVRYPHTGPLLEALEDLYPATRPRRVTHALTVGSFAVLAALTVALVMGWLMSVAFNNTLERAAFADEGPRDWIVWGLRASVAPAFIFGVAWLLSACSLGARQLLMRLSEKARQLDARLRRLVAGALHRAALDEPVGLASWTLLASAATLIALWWYFAPLFNAFSTSISTGDRRVLALLSPTFQDYQDNYRQAFSALLFASVMAWLAVWRLASVRRQPPANGIIAGAGIMLGLTLASLDLPYRLLIQSKVEAVSWNGQACYRLGERKDDVLLICPALSPPRRRVVPKTDASLKPLDKFENVYTGFATP